MPLQIRELNIKVNVDSSANPPRSGQAGAAEQNANDITMTLRKTLDEFFRIEALKKER